MLLPSILPCASIETLPLNGPVTEDLLIYFYLLPSTCYQALKVGAIDIMAYPLTENQYLDAIDDPDIVLASHSLNDMYGFPFNLNETIKTYSDFDPVLVSPMTYLEFRQATSVPSSNWFAGAGLALEGGKIDIFVTVSSKYGQEFGHPPP